jgi:hypothetical protein
MGELERLKRRRESWDKCQGPRWLLFERERIIRELNAEIAKLEGRAKP